MEMYTGMLQEIGTLSCAGWAKWIVIGLRIFSAGLLIASVGLNLAVWMRVTIR